MMRSATLLLFLFTAIPASAQQNQCRTSPIGASTSYCASEAFVTQSRGSLEPAIFGSLASCTFANEGDSAAVTDSTTATWGATITGSGTLHVLAYCNGTNWTVVGG